MSRLDRERALQDRFLRRRSELIDGLAHDEAEAALPLAQRGEDLTPSQHPADVASDLEQRERLLGQISSRHARLASVDDALERLAEGLYGRCTDCGGEIAPERLAALPQAARCIDCQLREERTRPRHGRR